MPVGRRGIEMRALICRINELSTTTTTIVILYETTIGIKEDAYVTAKKDERSTAKYLHVELVRFINNVLTSLFRFAF